MRIWKPVTAGVLSITLGVLSYVMAISYVLVSAFYEESTIYHAVGGLIVFLIGVLGIAGGYFSIKRTRYNLARTGAFASWAAFTVAPFMLTGLSLLDSPEQVVGITLMGLCAVIAVVMARTRLLAIISGITLVIIDSGMYYLFFHVLTKYIRFYTPLHLHPLMAVSLIGVIPVVLIFLSSKEFKK